MQRWYEYNKGTSDYSYIAHVCCQAYLAPLQSSIITEGQKRKHTVLTNSYWDGLGPGSIRTTSPKSQAIACLCRLGQELRDNVDWIAATRFSCECNTAVGLGPLRFVMCMMLKNRLVDCFYCYLILHYQFALQLHSWRLSTDQVGQHVM